MRTPELSIALLGPRGQVGWQLQRSLAVLGRGRGRYRQGGAGSGDVSRPDGLRQALRSVRPHVIVNAAAWTAVDKAESERAAADAVNHLACGVLAEEAARAHALLVHYSTDYVFPGTGERPWVETDATDPVNAYGQTKLDGEQAIARVGGAHLILRTSWVFDTWGQNFLKTIVRAATQRDALTVVDDQWGAPTRAALIADVTAHAIRRWLSVGESERAALSGLYHLAPAGFTNWHSYAQRAIAQAQAAGLAVRAAPEQVKPVPSTAYPTPAKRPANSRLDTRKLRESFDLVLPTWESGVDAVVRELVASGFFK